MSDISEHCNRASDVMKMRHEKMRYYFLLQQDPCSLNLVIRILIILKQIIIIIIKIIIIIINPCIGFLQVRGV